MVFPSVIPAGATAVAQSRDPASLRPTLVAPWVPDIRFANSGMTG